MRKPGTGSSLLSGRILLAVFFALLVLPGGWSDELSLEERDRFEAEQKALRVSLECYRIDYDRYPQHFFQLTTPITYCKPDLIQQALASWEYVVDANGLGYEARNLKSEKFSFCFDQAFTEKLQGLHGKKFQEFLSLAEREDKPYLRSEILSQGRQAFRQASREEQSDAIVVLRRFAADESGQVRAAALRILGDAGRPELLPVFLDALNDGSYRVRWAAIEALGKIQSPATLARLTQLLGDPDPRTRRQALSAIAQFKQPESLPALLQAARDPDPGVRGQALQCCAEHREESVFEALKGALDDPVESVRAEAIAGLTHFPGQRTAAALAERFLREPSAQLRVRTFNSLRAIGAEAEIKDLSGRMSTETKVELVKNDLRLMATAIEARFVDNSSYLVPDEVFVPGSVFARRYEVDSETVQLWNRLPKDKRPTYGLRKHEKQFTEAEQRIWEQIEQRAGGDIHKYQNFERNRSLGFEVLTTPVAYLASVPWDPFNNNFLGRYRYGTPKVERGWASLWMLISNGPDEDVDIDPAYVVFEDNRKVWLYAAYPFESAPQRLEGFIYDPTNGVLSNGDVVRFGP